MEAPAVTLDLLGVVHRLLTGRTFGSSPPVWHLFREKSKLQIKEQNHLRLKMLITHYL